MKNITLILLLVFTSLAQCQTANIITSTEFYNIKINSISLEDIINTHGVENEFQSLFGTPASKDINEDGYYSYYVYDGFEINFSSLLSGKAEHILGSFAITNNNYNITIQGNTVTIGDHINLLGDVVFNTMRDGKKSIVYQYCDGCNNFISIRFNQVTNVITEIIYIEQT